MENKVKVSKSGYNWVKGSYLNEDSRLKGMTIKMSDIEYLKGKCRNFKMYDFFGDCCDIKFTISDVQETKYDFIITITSSKTCPERFFPLVDQILGKEKCKNENLLYPISYCIK